MAVQRYGRAQQTNKHYFFIAAASFCLGFAAKTYVFSPNDRVVHRGLKSEVILDGVSYPLENNQMGTLQYRLEGILSLPPKQVKSALEHILSYQ